MASVWTIRRSATETKVAGVCGGIAQHWNVDPVLVRVGFAMLALSGGIGVVLYLAGWLLVPVEGQDTAPIDDLLGEQARRWPREVWVVVVVVACVVSFGALEPLSPFGFGPAVILAMIWYFGYYRKGRRAPGPGESQPPAAGIAPAPPMDQPTFTYPGPPSAFTEAAEVWRQRVEEHQQTLRQPTQNPPVPDASGDEPADDRSEPAGLASPRPAPRLRTQRSCPTPTPSASMQPRSRSVHRRRCAPTGPPRCRPDACGWSRSWCSAWP